MGPWLLALVGLVNGVAWLTGARASGTVVLCTLASAVLGPWLILRCTVPKDWKRYAVWREKPF